MASQNLLIELCFFLLIFSNESSILLLAQLFLSDSRFVRMVAHGSFGRKPSAHFLGFKFSSISFILNHCALKHSLRTTGSGFE